MSETQESRSDDPVTETVVDTVLSRREDVPEEEVRERAAAAVEELSQGKVTSFTTPLAINRVRDEVKAEHGPPPEFAGGTAAAGTDEAPGGDGS